MARITQDIYEEIIKENIVGFNMTPEEAIKSTINQFESQGVDLSHIIQDVRWSPENNDLVVGKLQDLKRLYQNCADPDRILSEMGVLLSVCKKDSSIKARIANDGGYNILIQYLDTHLNNYEAENVFKNEILVIKTLECLICLMDEQEDLLDWHGVELIKRTFDSIKNEHVLSIMLKMTNKCAHNAHNRQKYVALGIHASLKTVLQVTEMTEIISDTLQLVKILQADDGQVDVGKTHALAREIGVYLMEPLTEILIQNKAPLCNADVLNTISSLLDYSEPYTKNERLPEVLNNLLSNHYNDVTVVQHTIKLITALAGNNQVKVQLVNSGIIPYTITLLAKYWNNPVTVEHLLKCIAALAFQEPAHCNKFFENKVAEAIVDCMRIHETNAAVQKNACVAIKNLIAKCPSQNSRFQMLGIEAILKKSYQLFGEHFGYDIRSALRDLGCDFTLVGEWTGNML